MTTKVYQPERRTRAERLRVESWKSTLLSVAICITLPCLIGIAAMVWA